MYLQHFRFIELFTVSLLPDRVSRLVFCYKPLLLLEVERAAHTNMVKHMVNAGQVGQCTCIIAGRYARPIVLADELILYLDRQALRLLWCPYAVSSYRYVV